MLQTAVCKQLGDTEGPYIHHCVTQVHQLGFLTVMLGLILLLSVCLAVTSGLAGKDGKRGTGYDFSSVADLQVLDGSSAIAWFYNWGVQPPSNTSAYATRHGIEYVPMQVG